MNNLPPKWEPTPNRQTIKVTGTKTGDKNGKVWTRVDLDVNGQKVSWFPAPWQVEEVIKYNGRVINVWLDEKKKLHIDAEPIINTETGAIINPKPTPAEDPGAYWLDQKKILENAIYTAYRSFEDAITRLIPDDDPEIPLDLKQTAVAEFKDKYITADTLERAAISLYIEAKKRV